MQGEESQVLGGWWTAVQGEESRGAGPLPALAHSLSLAFAPPLGQALPSSLSPSPLAVRGE